MPWESTPPKPDPSALEEGRLAEAEPMGTESPMIFAGAIEVGLARLRNSPLLMAMNGLIGGLFVIFSGLGALTLYAALDFAPRDLAWLVAALLYPFGFIFVIIGKSELFTENFLTPVLATWDNRLSPRPLLKLWSITLAANLVGVSLGALAWSYPAFGLLSDHTRQAFVDVASDDLARPLLVTLAKGVVGGILINFMSWLVIAARGHLTKLAMMFLPTYLIMALHAAHSVVGSFEVLVGALSGAPGGVPAWAWRFLAPAAVGNMIGGVVFVSALHYAQVREERRVKEGERAEELSDESSDAPARPRWS